MGLYGCALLRELGFLKVFVNDVRQDRLMMVTKFGGIPYNQGMFDIVVGYICKGISEAKRKYFARQIYLNLFCISFV